MIDKQRLFLPLLGVAVGTLVWQIYLLSTTTTTPLEVPKEIYPTPPISQNITIPALQHATHLAETRELSAKQLQYLQLVNELRISQVKRLIAQDNEAIAISERHMQKAGSTLAQTDHDAKVVARVPSHATQEDAFKLIYTGEQSGQWNATINIKGRLYDVVKGTKLPTGDTVANIDQDVVILSQGGWKKVLSFYDMTRYYQPAQETGTVAAQARSTTPAVSAKSVPVAKAALPTQQAISPQHGHPVSHEANSQHRTEQAVIAKPAAPAKQTVAALPDKSVPVVKAALPVQQVAVAKPAAPAKQTVATLPVKSIPIAKAALPAQQAVIAKPIAPVKQTVATATSSTKLAVGEKNARPGKQIVAVKPLQTVQSAKADHKPVVLTQKDHVKSALITKPEPVGVPSLLAKLPDTSAPAAIALQSAESHKVVEKPASKVAVQTPPAPIAEITTTKKVPVKMNAQQTAGKQPAITKVIVLKPAVKTPAVIKLKPELAAKQAPNKKVTLVAKPIIPQRHYSEVERQLLTQDPNQFTLQLFSAPTLTSVQKFMNENKLSGKANIYTSYQNNHPRYVVVVEHFKTAEEALQGLTTLPIELHQFAPEVKSIASIQQELKELPQVQSKTIG